MRGSTVGNDRREKEPSRPPASLLSPQVSGSARSLLSSGVAQIAPWDLLDRPTGREDVLFGALLAISSFLPHNLQGSGSQAVRRVLEAVLTAAFFKLNCAAVSNRQLQNLKANRYQYLSFSKIVSILT